MDFLAVYSEAVMIGVVGAMFIYMVYSMNRRGNEQAEALQNLKIENKGQSENIQNIDSILLKLLDRWNKSDETRDRRHEKLVEEVNDLSDILMEVKGNLSRINGKS